MVPIALATKYLSGKNEKSDRKGGIGEDIEIISFDNLGYSAKLSRSNHQDREKVHVTVDAQGATKVLQCTERVSLKEELKVVVQYELRIRKLMRKLNEITAQKEQLNLTNMETVLADSNLLWMKASNNLRIEVLEAIDLPARGTKNDSNPYCVVTLRKELPKQAINKKCYHMRRSPDIARKYSLIDHHMTYFVENTSNPKYHNQAFISVIPEFSRIHIQVRCSHSVVFSFIKITSLIL